MKLDEWETAAVAIAYIGAKVYAYFRKDAKDEKRKEHLCEDVEANARKITDRIEVQEKTIAGLSDQLQTLRVAISAMNTSVTNQSKALTNLSDKVDKQGRLLVEIGKTYKLSEKTVIPGGKNEG